MQLGPDVPVVLYGAGPDSFAVRRAAQYLLDSGNTDVSLVVCGVDGLVGAGVDAASGPTGNEP
jgi:hypothetical protein